MAHFKETKLDNGNIGLEITYGGTDAPFGGVDTSAPPMYISRNCFTDASGFIVINEQLIACGWLNSGITLGGWATTMTYLGSGSWWVNGAYKNFVLATASVPLVNPTRTSLRFYIWTWDSDTAVPATIPITQQIAIVQGPEFTTATAATAQISVSNSYTVSVATTITITVNATPVNVTYNQAPTTPCTPQQLAQAIVAAINGSVGYPVTAALNSDGLTITLTTSAMGAAANSTTLSVSYNPTTGATSGVNIIGNFSGGADSYSLPSGQFPNQITWTTVGESLYFSCPGATLMLTYTEVNGTPQFSILTQYLGGNFLTKFNGQLITAGITLGPGLRLTSPEMIVAWSAPNQLGVWNPTNADGTVTGAGFNQETDISDYLTGIIIGNGAAILLKTQGIDYMTPLSGGVIPFDFVHISNSVQGEGCQDYRLITQYDQVGAFVGNTDIYTFAGSLTPIGQKIRNTLLASLKSTITNRGSISGPFGTNPFTTSPANISVIFMFLIDFNIYVYAATSKTWMIFPLAQLGGGDLNLFWLAFWKVLTNVSGQPQFNTPAYPILVSQDAYNTAPTFWYMTQAVQNADFPHGVSGSYVTFPVEEVAFGRDVTIESAYINCAGVPGQEIIFTIYGQKNPRDGGGTAAFLQGSITLPASASPTVFQNYQVYFTTTPDDVNAVQNPQLKLLIPAASTGTKNYLSIAKVALFGSYDPAQRPV